MFKPSKFLDKAKPTLNSTHSYGADNFSVATPRSAKTTDQAQKDLTKNRRLALIRRTMLKDL